MASEQDSAQTVLFHWQWNKKLLAFALIFLPVTVSLGVWQLQRAEQKRDILDAQQQRIDAAPVSIETVIGETDKQFINVVAVGEVDPARVFLLDNRVRYGRPGYEVLNELELDINGTAHWVLVNRGWVPGGLDRSVLPQVSALPAGPIVGYLYRSPSKSIVLKTEVWPKDNWPLVIQAIDVEKLSGYLGHEIFPYTLRVVDDPVATAGVSTKANASYGPAPESGWAVVNVLPEKHIGYAVQWFLMALALLVLTLFSNSNLAGVLSRTRH